MSIKFDRWSLDDGQSLYFPERTDGSTKNLPGGLYNVFQSHRGPCFRKMTLRTDDLCRFSGGAFSILGEIEKFWDGKEKYEKFLSLAHRRGILLEGPPGNGKTMIIQEAIMNLIQRDGLALQFGDSNYELIIDTIRQIQPSTPIVAVLEDIDKMSLDNEERLLAVMDGVSSSHGGILFLATTNKLDKVSERIRSRPSRIDAVVHVGPPDERIRAQYINHILKDHNPVLERELISKTKGMSFAEIKGAIVGVVVYERSVDEACKRKDQIDE